MPLGFVVDFVPGTMNAEEGFQMMPVGAAFIGGLFGSTVLQEVVGTTVGFWHSVSARGSARDCLPRREGRSYDRQIYPLAPPAKCDRLHTY
jgi:hypothetical protein